MHTKTTQNMLLTVLNDQMEEKTKRRRRRTRCYANSSRHPKFGWKNTTKDLADCSIPPPPLPLPPPPVSWLRNVHASFSFIAIIYWLFHRHYSFIIIILLFLFSLCCELVSLSLPLTLVANCIVYVCTHTCYSGFAPLQTHTAAARMQSQQNNNNRASPLSICSIYGSCDVKSDKKEKQNKNQ